MYPPAHVHTHTHSISNRKLQFYFYFTHLARVDAPHQTGPVLESPVVMLFCFFGGGGAGE
jgi:hypothetical protein